MKNIVILYIAISISSISNAQSILGCWQLQNPFPYYKSEMLIFNEDGSFKDFSLDLHTKVKSNSEGTYIINAYNQLTLNFKMSRISSGVTWISRNEFLISINKATYHFSKVGSPQDPYMTNLLNKIFYNDPVASPYSGQSNICSTCHGTGICPVCHGARSNSYYGVSSPCSACNASGRCWNCNGKGNK